MNLWKNRENLTTIKIGLIFFGGETMTLQEIIKSLDSLSGEEQDSLLEILRQRRVEAIQAEILANAQELKEAMAAGTARIGTVDDLIADLSEDEDEGS